MTQPSMGIIGAGSRGNRHRQVLSGLEDQAIIEIAGPWGTALRLAASRFREAAWAHPHERCGFTCQDELVPMAYG